MELFPFVNPAPSFFAVLKEEEKMKTKKQAVRDRQTYRLIKPIIFSRPGLKPWGNLPRLCTTHAGSTNKMAYLKV